MCVNVRWVSGGSGCRYVCKCVAVESIKVHIYLLTDNPLRGRVGECMYLFALHPGNI